MSDDLLSIFYLKRKKFSWSSTRSTIFNAKLLDTRLEFSNCRLKRRHLNYSDIVFLACRFEKLLRLNVNKNVVFVFETLFVHEFQE